MKKWFDKFNSLSILEKCEFVETILRKYESEDWRKRWDANTNIPFPLESAIIEYCRKYGEIFYDEENFGNVAWKVCGWIVKTNIFDNNKLSSIEKDESYFNMEFYIKEKVDTFHLWGDSWPYWNELGEAITEVERKLKKAHIGSSGKEKFGTYRLEDISFFNGSLNSWFDPSPYQNKFRLHPKTVRRAKIYKALKFQEILDVISKADNWIGSHLVPKKFIEKIKRSQEKKYNDIFQEVCKKYYPVLNELLVDNCHPELIDNGDVDGLEIFKKYYNGYKGY